MGQRLGLIGIKQNDIAGPGLLAPNLETQADAVDLVRVLPTFQRVSRAAPAEPPFCLSRMLGVNEKSACRSGVRPPRIIAARSSWVGSPLVRGARRWPPPGPVHLSPPTDQAPEWTAMPRPRLRRTIVASGARNRRLHQTLPRSRDCSSLPTSARMARPLSASPRSSEPASSVRADFCSFVALNGDRLLIVTTQSESRMAMRLSMCDGLRNFCSEPTTPRASVSRETYGPLVVDLFHLKNLRSLNFDTQAGAQRTHRQIEGGKDCNVHDLTWRQQFNDIFVAHRLWNSPARHNFVCNLAHHLLNLCNVLRYAALPDQCISARGSIPQASPTGHNGRQAAIIHRAPLSE